MLKASHWALVSCLTPAGATNLCLFLLVISLMFCKEMVIMMVF